MAKGIGGRGEGDCLRETINRGTAIIRENKVCITSELSILKKKYFRIF